MKFSTTIEIYIIEGQNPSIQDVQDLMQYLIEYGSLNIRDSAKHIPIQQASFKIKDTKDITLTTNPSDIKV